MTPLVALHASAAALAVPLGAAVLLLPRGTAMHRAMGRAWASLMLVAAVTSFGITGINGPRFSWIHLLSLWVILWLGIALWRVRRGDIAGHRRAMTGLFIGLLAAGAGALLPVRSLSLLLQG
ncbi:MAG: DUF2306 domain-containing protein [Sphingomonadaceae bacterium]